MGNIPKTETEFDKQYKKWLEKNAATLAAEKAKNIETVTGQNVFENPNTKTDLTKKQLEVGGERDSIINAPSVLDLNPNSGSRKATLGIVTTAPEETRSHGGTGGKFGADNSKTPTTTTPTTTTPTTTTPTTTTPTTTQKGYTEEEIKTIVNNAIAGNQANAEAEAKAQKEAEYKNAIIATLQQLTNTLTPSEEKQKATLATQEQIRQNLAKIMAMGEKNNTQIGNLVNDSSAMIKDAYGENKKLTGSAYDYILSNPYESDIGKSIMNFYNMQGSKGASEATAEAAATNAGNIDSYSAANANRQRLAFTNAGTEAIRAQHNDTTANLLNTLQQFGINVSDLIAKHNENVKNQQAYNAELMGQYTEGAKAETDAITEAEKNRLALKSDIANYISQLLGTKSSNETQKEIAKIDADTQKYLGDRDTDIALRGTTTVDTATPTQIYEAFQALITGNYEGFDAVSPDEAVAVLLETYPGSKDYINSYVKQWANDLK